MINIKSSIHEEEDFTKIRLLPVSLKILNLEKLRMFKDLKFQVCNSNLTSPFLIYLCIQIEQQ